MANDLADNPYKIDTAGVITPHKMFISQMVWRKPAEAEDKLVILDSNGRILWNKNAYIGGKGVSIKQDINHFCNGITVDTIDSGTLYIHLRQKKETKGIRDMKKAIEDLEKVIAEMPEIDGYRPSAA